MSSSEIDVRERATREQGGRRFLIFGAYSNGNIGDQFQANSLAYHIRRLCPGVEVFATSNSSAGRPYEFEPEHVLPEEVIHHPDTVNQFDALIVGGGGLLASVHKPLANPHWADSIECPIVLLALGASREVAGKCEAVIRRAAVATARDSFSLEVLQEIRPDTTMLYDPILMDDRLDRESKTSDNTRFCLIPRKMTEKNQGVYQLLSEQMVGGDMVLSMFPATDGASGALRTLNKPEATIEAWKMQELVDAIDQAEYLVSERYHGCILGLKRGIPTLGLVNSNTEARSKIGELYRQLGHGHLLLSYRNHPLTREQIAAKLDAEFDAATTKLALASMRKEFERDARALLGAL